MTMSGERDRAILDAVLRGLALNRVPGYHFIGNFFGTTFEQVSSGETRVELEPGPYSVEPDGTLNIGGLVLLADLAMGTSIRTNVDARTRLTTSRLQLDFTGVPADGPLLASGTYQGQYSGGAGRQGLSRVEIRRGGRLVSFGSSAFMELPLAPDSALAPFPWRRPCDPPVPPLDADRLDPAERRIVGHAQAVLAAPDPERRSFISRFLGYHPQRTAGGAVATLPNGPHLGNRVGHAQGGILVGLAAATAQAALGAGWGVTSAAASFLKPGDGATIQARSSLMHAGRLTAVVHTQIESDGKLVVEALTTHAFLAGSATANR